MDQTRLISKPRSSDDGLVGDLRVLVLADDPIDASHRYAKIEGGRHPYISLHITRSVIVLTALRRYTPDVIVIDLSPHGSDPLAFTTELLTHIPSLCLVVVAPRPDPLVASRVLRAGALAFVARTDPRSCLTQAIVHASHHERYVSETIMQTILGAMKEEPARNNLEDVSRLSDRELTVLRLIGEGAGLLRIARELHVSTKTVATHRSNIRKKLHISSAHDLSVIARDWVDAGTARTAQAGT